MPYTLFLIQWQGTIMPFGVELWWLNSLKNKSGFVDGSILRPEGTDDLFNSWIHNNDIVISWILNSESKEISASVKYSESAHKVWIYLKECYQDMNGPRIFQLRRELMNQTQGQLFVSTYFTKLILFRRA